MDGSGKQLNLHCGMYTGSISGPGCDVRHGTSGGFTGVDSPGGTPFNVYWGGRDVVVKLVDDNTNLKITLQTDGDAGGLELLSQSRTSWMASGPTKLFVGLYNSASSYTNYAIDFLGTH
jgi:hypothetical protein